MRLLDLFCGRWGWSRAFAARGWECVGVDLCDLNETVKPAGCEFICADVLDFRPLHVLRTSPQVYRAITSGKMICPSVCSELILRGVKAGIEAFTAAFYEKEKSKYPLVAHIAGALDPEAIAKQCEGE